MTAFPDNASTSALERAALAYHIATGRESLTPHADAVKWALEHADPLCDPRDIRAVEAMRLWLDEVVSDDDTRARLGLEAKPEPVAETWPAWTRLGSTMRLLHLSEDDAMSSLTCEVANVGHRGWVTYESPECGARVASGPETGPAGMDAAEAALRRAGVLAEGVTVRRAVSL